MMKGRLYPLVGGRAMRPFATDPTPIRPGRLSALWSLSAVLLVAPVHAATPLPTVHPPKREAGRVARPVAAKRRKSGVSSTDEEYVHVYYELSPSRGFHIYVRAPSGAQREITDEPGWEVRHKKALEAHHHARREHYIRLHPEMDSTTRTAIEAGWLTRGMTTEQARACAGRPVEEKRTLTRDGLIEDWRYGMELLDGTGELPHDDVARSCAGPGSGGRVSSCVLHFVDGILMGWDSLSAGVAPAVRRDPPP